MFSEQEIDSIAILCQDLLDKTKTKKEKYRERLKDILRECNRSQIE